MLLLKLQLLLKSTYCDWPGDEHCSPRVCPRTSKMTSISTGGPSGRLATPYTKRGLLSLPRRLVPTPKRRQRQGQDPKRPSARIGLEALERRRSTMRDSAPELNDHQRSQTSDNPP